MSHRLTITLDDEAYGFVEKHARGNRSAFINRVLKAAQKKRLEESIKRACLEESQDQAYQAELVEWDVCVADGLDDEANL